VTQLSADLRSRRRRTVAKDQLALALGGAAEHVWAVSFIVTNSPVDDSDYVGLEAWFRNRSSIEERFREVKHGAGLNHLPSADRSVNSVGMWAGLPAGAFSVMLQSLTGLDTQAHAPGWMRIATLRHRLLNVPGRLVRHARGLTLRLPPGHQTLPNALARLRALPALPDHPAPPRPAPPRPDEQSAPSPGSGHIDDQRHRRERSWSPAGGPASCHPPGAARGGVDRGQHRWGVRGELADRAGHRHV